MDLAHIVAERGSVRGNYVVVDSFLNHRVEPGILARVGAEAELLVADTPFDIILTAEASGIPPAMALSAKVEKPFIYAKKSHIRALDAAFTRTISSPTKIEDVHLSIRRSVLEPGQRVLIVDDFLASGRSVVALASMVEEAGCTVAACVFVVEKTLDGGRNRLEAIGLEVRSLVAVSTVDDHLVVRSGR